MLSSLTVSSPAKLNLFLHITGQRDNGYHELQTLFQLIDLYDSLTFTLRADNAIQITGLAHVNLTDNLIYRAAKLLQPFARISGGCDIQLDKHIPMGAGLGGGSSNAATTLLVLNKLWDCQQSTTQLLTMAAQLGADVPIFVYGKNAWAEGIGDIITPIENLPKKQFIILKPDCFISTQTLFSEKTLTRDAKPTKFAAYQESPSQFQNHFEVLARAIYPEVEQAFSYLNQFGIAKLTGTGACVFLEVDCTNAVHEIIAKAPCQAYLVNSLAISPVLHAIQET